MGQVGRGATHPFSWRMQAMMGQVGRGATHPVSWRMQAMMGQVGRGTTHPVSWRASSDMGDPGWAQDLACSAKQRCTTREAAGPQQDARTTAASASTACASVQLPRCSAVWCSTGSTTELRGRGRMGQASYCTCMGQAHCTEQGRQGLVQGRHFCQGWGRRHSVQASHMFGLFDRGC